MGKYINDINGKPLPPTGKVSFLIMQAGATPIHEPEMWQPDLVCVVDNGAFQAAAYAYDEQEMNVFKRPDGRPRMWLNVPNAAMHAK